MYVTISNSHICILRLIFLPSPWPSTWSGLPLSDFYSTLKLAHWKDHIFSQSLVDCAEEVLDYGGFWREKKGFVTKRFHWVLDVIFFWANYTDFLHFFIWIVRLIIMKSLIWCTNLSLNRAYNKAYSNSICISPCPFFPHWCASS